MATLYNVQPELALRVTWMIRLSQGRFWIQSGWRSVAEQTALYNLHQMDPKKYPTAAKPGFSKHNRTPAEAVDVACQPDDKDLRVALAWRCGLHTPIPGEPWHMELAAWRTPLPDEPKPQEEELPRYADQIVYPTGAKTQVFPDGAIKNFGTPFFGSLFDVPPEGKRAFTRADAITAVDPNDAGAGYIVWNEGGQRFRFDPSWWTSNRPK
jgi:hypothetical protein